MRDYRKKIRKITSEMHIVYEDTVDGTEILSLG